MTHPILYIEDNFHNRRLVRKILQSRGYDVLEAEDGQTGLALLQSHRPPIVLLDIGLPGMDGLEITAQIKENPAFRDIKVIALTASAMSGDRERFLAAGCDDYLSKPIHPLQLLDLVARYLPGAGDDGG